MRRSNFIQRFLWTCAGATVSILERQEVEHVKYTVIGTAVLLTGLLAGITGKCAFYTCFHHEGSSVIFGILWGVIIFNIDRSFILNASKGEKIEFASLKWFFSLSQTFVLFLVRLSIAILISLSFSTIIELELFKGEINTEIKSALVKTINAEYKTDIKDIQENIKTTIIEVERRRLAYEDQRRDAKEALGQTISFKSVSIDRRTARTLRANSDTAKVEERKSLAEYREADKKLKRLQNKLTALTENSGNLVILEKRKSEINKAPNDSGLIDRYKALKNIISRDKFLENLTTMLTLIMAMVEISPLLSKTMYPKGNYDDMVYARGNKQKEKYEKELEFEKNRFTKILEVTKERLDLNSEFADSELHPSNLFLSNDLISSSEDYLKSNSNNSKYESFKIYTDSEKQSQPSKNDSDGLNKIFHHRLAKMLEWYENLGKLEKFSFNFLSFAGFLTIFDKVGGFAKSTQSIAWLVENLKFSN